jgi:hypothetical protein
MSRRAKKKIGRNETPVGTTRFAIWVSHPTVDIAVSDVAMGSPPCESYSVFVLQSRSNSEGIDTHVAVCAFPTALAISARRA